MFDGASFVTVASVPATQLPFTSGDFSDLTPLVVTCALSVNQWPLVNLGEPGTYQLATVVRISTQVDIPQNQDDIGPAPIGITLTTSGNYPEATAAVDYYKHDILRLKFVYTGPVTILK